jgi:NAD(P)-dependent dehydrogenase (short-subunit alcohol dehydrogenase family)
MNRLQNKTTIVTGGAHGIGRAISELYAEEGAVVLIVDIDRDAGSEVANGISKSGGRAEFCYGDVASPKDTAQAVKSVTDKYGRVDILCANAAYLVPWHDVLGATEQEWQRCLQVALRGTDNYTREVLPWMVKARQGSIIIVASIQGLVACPTSIAYTFVKTGLIGYSRSVAYDYGEFNVRVNALCPGPIQTRITPKPGEPGHDLGVNRTLLRRFGQPREVAQAAVFLGSEESSYVTGSCLLVDGGWTAM